MNPFKLMSAYKEYLWGGNSLKTEYGKQTDCTPCAESWELSAHIDGPSTIQTGELKGIQFIDFIKKYPKEWNTLADATTPFPILVKLIDAEKSLSIQVHPNDAYALQEEGEQGKNEMWIILQAKPNAFLYYGFEKEVDKKEFEERIKNNTLTEILHKQPVKAGEVYYIPAGTIHAIGEGIVLAEVQQSSNSTYRVYDFGRKDAQGNLRPLHIKKALDVTELRPASKIIPGAKAATATEPEVLADCQYFTVKKIINPKQYAITPKQSFVALLCTNGTATLQTQANILSITKGECVFVPTSVKKTILEGTAEILQIEYNA